MIWLDNRLEVLFPTSLFPMFYMLAYPDFLIIYGLSEFLLFSWNVLISKVLKIESHFFYYFFYFINWLHISLSFEYFIFFCIGPIVQTIVTKFILLL